MPTYVLEGGSSVHLPAKPLTLRVQGAGQGEIRLEAWRDGAVDPTAIKPMLGMLVLPRVTGPTEVRVVPARERTFPSGTVVALSAAIELHGDVDPERAVMHGVDLSGLAQRELLRVEPAGAELRLTALGVVVDTPLPPLATRARDLAREILGVERVPLGEATALQISVDASASMRPLIAEGSIGAAMEVILGVSRVTSSDQAVAVRIGAEQAKDISAESIAQLPRAVHDALLETPLLTGFRCGVAPGGSAAVGSDVAGTASPGARTTLCVVSDGVPADLPAADGVALVAVVAESSRQVLRAGAPTATAWVPVGEWGTRSAYDLLMANEPALRDTVRQLLRALLPGTSSLADRLESKDGR